MQGDSSDLFDGREFRLDVGADGVAVLTLTTKENRFSPTYIERFHKVLDALEANAAVKVLVTIGVSHIYSNGLDTEFLLNGKCRDPATELLAPFHRFLARFMTLPFPTVAALNGHAFAGGAMLALSHDQMVMRDDRGFFCLPEVNIGLPFTVYMNALLSYRLPAGARNDLMVLGVRADAKRMHAWGMLAATATGDQLLAVATAAARALLKTGRAPTLQQIKTDLYQPVIAALETPVAKL